MPLNNPISEPQIPQLMARDDEVTAAMNAHTGALSEDPHAQYLPRKPKGIEFELNDANYLDFHVTPSPRTIDFDARLICSEGISQNGKATLALQAGLFNIIAKLSLNDGPALGRLLTTTTTIDLPLIASGGVVEINRNISGGAAVGDIAFFVPTEMPLGLAFINIQAIISSVGVAKIYFHNFSSSALDISAFSGRLLVFGF